MKANPLNYAQTINYFQTVVDGLRKRNIKQYILTKSDAAKLSDILKHCCFIKPICQKTKCSN